MCYIIMVYMFTEMLMTLLGAGMVMCSMATASVSSSPAPLPAAAAAAATGGRRQVFGRATGQEVTSC